MTILRLSIAGSMLLLGLLAGCTTVKPEADLPDALASARSPVEHAQAAEHFAKKAKRYEADADFHARLGRSYVGGGRAGPEKQAAMASHCRALETQLREAAREARELEKAHRELAETGASAWTPAQPQTGR